MKKSRESLSKANLKPASTASQVRTTTSRRPVLQSSDNAPICSKASSKQQDCSMDCDQQEAVGALISLVKTRITFRFEDQKFLPLALHLSEANPCNCRNMTNHEHLQRFQNLVDVAVACNGQLCERLSATAAAFYDKARTVPT